MTQTTKIGNPKLKENVEIIQNTIHTHLFIIYLLMSQLDHLPLNLNQIQNSNLFKKFVQKQTTPEAQNIPSTKSPLEKENSNQKVKFNPSFEPSCQEFVDLSHNETKQWIEPQQDKFNESSIYHEFAQITKKSNKNTPDRYQYNSEFIQPVQQTYKIPAQPQIPENLNQSNLEVEQLRAQNEKLSSLLNGTHLLHAYSLFQTIEKRLLRRMSSSNSKF